MTRIKRYLLRDLGVYFISGAKLALRKKKPSILWKDMKYFRQWWKYRKTGTGTLTAEIPWLVFDVITYLERYLNKELRVFEYGSGGSTIFFAHRVKEIISVEHDAAWYKMVAAYIKTHTYENIDYRLLEPVEDTGFAKKKWDEPADFISIRGEYRGKSFEAYATQINSCPDNYFDLVVVDGRVRASCIQQSISKVKKDGILLLDNADRGYYLSPFPELNESSKWKSIVFEGHFPFAPASVLNTTILFQKLY
jgi:hypothetical protein